MEIEIKGILSQDELVKRYNELVEKLKECREDYLRALADFDNYRKNVPRRIEEEKDRERVKIFSDLVRVVDDMDRAMKMLQNSDVDEQFIKGVEMIYQQILQFLKNHGVEQFSAHGKEFDPDYHEAMMVREGDEDNVVVEEFEKGYTYRGRLLKPARVVVSKKKG